MGTHNGDAMVTLRLDHREQWLIQRLRRAWYQDDEIEVLLVPQFPGKVDSKHEEEAQKREALDGRKTNGEAPGLPTSAGSGVEPPQEKEG